MDSKTSNNCTMIIIIAALLFFFVILPMLDKKNKEDMTNLENTMKLDTRMCSKECCNHTQWPVPHDTRSKEMKGKYTGSNLTCESGCLCVEQKDLDMLSQRGSNAGKSMCGN